jgi:hypothetical protein
LSDLSGWAERLYESDHTDAEYRRYLQATATQGRRVVSLLRRFQPTGDLDPDEKRELLRQRDVAVRIVENLVQRAMNAASM